MSHGTNPVQRTAPIPIAPKPPRPDPAPQRQGQDSFRRFEIGPPSLPATRGSTERVSASAPSSSNTRSQPPCEACHHSSSRCIPSEDDDGCMSCQVNAAECSLSSSPQTRKRKLNGESSINLAGKRRFVPFSISDSLVSDLDRLPLSALLALGRCLISTRTFLSPQRVPIRTQPYRGIRFSSLNAEIGD